MVNSSRATTQRGATLIVALIALLAISLLTVSSRQSATLQQQMSSAYQQRSLSNYAAETGLRTAETWLRNNVTDTSDLNDFFNSTTGLYSNYPLTGIYFTTQPSSNSISDPEDPTLWDDNSSIEITDYDSSVAKAPRYFIEYMGRSRGSARRTIIDYGDPNAAANTDPHVFQITAIGWARDEGIYTVLQSSFHTGQGSSNFTY